MSEYRACPYAGSADLPSLIELAQNLTRARYPQPAYYHPGDFVWQLYQFDESEDVRLWRDAHGTIVACAIFEPPLTFQFAIDPVVPHPKELAAEVIQWVEQRRAHVSNKQDIPLAYRGLGNDTLSSWALESDAERTEMLTACGFSRGDAGGVRFRLDLRAPPPEPLLPSGARFRSMSDPDLEARAALHREAWSVWGESKFSAELYRRLRAAPLYDPDLDIVLEFDGELVSYCVCWLDAVNKVGYFEPVGTKASATGRGFGGAVIREGQRRLRDKGMQLAFVGTANVNRPAQALYVSAGFDIVEHEWFYVKPDSGSC